MITKEQMLAFARQQIKERGLPQIEKEAAIWARKNKLITQEKFLAMPKEKQIRTMVELTCAYIRSLM